MDYSVSIENLSFQYNTAAPRALAGVSLAIPSGSCCALLGPTGSGKSTLANALAGVLGTHYKNAPCTGTVRIGSASYLPIPDRILFPTVGMCMQEPYVQVSGMRDTVYEEILLTLENIGNDGSEASNIIETTLGSLGIAHLAGRDPRKISGGELQRVALATILVAQPPLLLFDEPTNSLDLAGKMVLASTLQRLKRERTVLLFDHSVDLALAVADHIGVISSGTLIFYGSRGDFLSRIGSFRSILPIESWRDSIDLIERSGTIAARKVAKALEIP